MTFSPAAQAKRDELARNHSQLGGTSRYSFHSGFDQGHAFAMQECAGLVEVLERIESNPTSDSTGITNQRNNWTEWAKKIATEAIDKFHANFKSNNKTGEQGGEG